MISEDEVVNPECLCRDPPEVCLPCYIPERKPCALPGTRVYRQEDLIALQGQVVIEHGKVTQAEQDPCKPEKYSDEVINKCCTVLCFALVMIIVYAFWLLLDHRFLLHCYVCQGPEKGPCGKVPSPLTNRTFFEQNRVLCLGKVCVARCEGGRKPIITRGCEDFEKAVARNRTALAGNTDVKQAVWCNEPFELGACNAYPNVCKVQKAREAEVRRQGNRTGPYSRGGGTYWNEIPENDPRNRERQRGGGRGGGRGKNNTRGGGRGNKQGTTKAAGQGRGSGSGRGRKTTPRA